MAKFKPKLSESIAVLEHVRYEISRCFFHDTSPLINEAWLLSLVHARQVIDFFEKTDRKGKDDDVLCSDFNFDPRPLSIPEKTRLRLNKDLAHLTYARLRHSRESKPWNLPLVLQPILIRSIEFSNYIAHAYPHTPAKERGIWAQLHAALTSLQTVITIDRPMGSSAIGL
jgi:hypothetical protein